MNYKSLVCDCLETGHWDRARFEAARQGDLDCVHVTLGVWEDFRETVREITRWRRLLEENADLATVANTVDDVVRANENNQTAFVFGLQNTAAFEDDIELIGVLHDLGIRIAQITYNIQNLVGSGCWEPADRGLSTTYGRGVVREMNRVGMLIDLSHVGEATSQEAAELSERPVSITHANPRDFVGEDVELPFRNKSTRLVKTVCEKGGVIGLSPYPRMSRGGSDSTLKQFCEMVEWTVELVGPQSVGIGTDLNLGNENKMAWFRKDRFAREFAVQPKGGPTRWPDWFSSPAHFGGIAEGLRDRGFEQDVIDGVMGGNWMRLFDESFKPMDAK